MRYNTMIKPVTAMTAFLPTEEDQRRPSRFMGWSWSDVDDSLSGADRLRGLVQLLALARSQPHLDDLLQTSSANLAGHATEDVSQAKLSLQPRGARENAFLVERDRLDHLDRRRTGRVIGRPGFEERDDLRATVSRARHDVVELGLFQ